MSLRSKICVFIALALTTLCVAEATASADVPIGKGCTTLYHIDNDCDGYGVGYGYVIGPDADDNDPTLNTTATVISKYGTLSNRTNLASFLSEARGYSFNEVWYIATDGNNSTGRKNDESKPFATFAGVISADLSAGDLVLYRGGSYSHNIDVQSAGVEGSPGSPIIVMSYPGELAIFSASSTNLYLFTNEYWIFDTLQFGVSSSDTGGNGIDGHDLDDIEFRYIECIRKGIGFKMMVDNHNVTVEKSVFSLSHAAHNIYWGSSGAANSNVTIRDSIIHSNAAGYPGFQHNGAVTNLVLDGNIVHSNGGDGIAFLCGVKNSTVKNNLIFNNNKYGIKVYRYTTSWSDDCDDNLFINNTIWAGKYANDQGGANPADYSCVQMINTDNNNAHEGNIFRNNIFVTYGKGAFNSVQKRHIENSIVENNILYRMDGTDVVCHSSDSPYTWTFSAFEAMNSSIKNSNNSDPLFEDTSVDYNSRPSSFNFDLTASSPAIDFGTLTGAPPDDLRGTTRSGIPDDGCYEYGSGSPSPPKNLRIAAQ